MNFDVIIIGAGPGGIYCAYELIRTAPQLKVALFEAGHPLAARHCPIDGVKVKTCVGCKTCSIMSGFGGAALFQTANTTSRTILAAPCTSISASSRHWI